LKESPQPVQEGAEQGWVAPFAAVLVMHFLTFALLQSVFPFLALYLRLELGTTDQEAIAWAGAIQAIGTFVLIFSNTIWGHFAERLGLKVTAFRTALGTGATFMLMSFCVAPWQVLAARSVQGLTGGAAPALVTLATKILPPTRLGMGMGLMQSVQFLGVSAGPVLGGLAATAFGFKGSFFASGALMWVTAFAFFLLTKEPKYSRTGHANESLMDRIRKVRSTPRLRTPILAALAFQGSFILGTMFLPLQFLQLHSNEQEVAATVGFVLAVGAIGGAIGATALSWLAPRVGLSRMILILLVSIIAFTVPQAFVTEIWHFAPLRFGLSFFAGGLMPTLRTLVADEATERGYGNLSGLYGLLGSGFTAGITIGSTLGALFGVAMGVANLHLVSGAWLLLAAGLWAWVYGTGRRTPRVAETVS
jgi:DHA1 family multidrug resistance protein-like MFS transporter